MAQASVSLNPALARYLVIVVDDDPAIRASLKFNLELEGYTVETFDTAEALLADPWPERAACIVIDYRLPGMNGLQLLHALRLRSVSSPVVLITSNPDRALAKAAAAAHAPIVEKPLLNDALSLELAQAVRRHPGPDDPD